MHHPLDIARNDVDLEVDLRTHLGPKRLPMPTSYYHDLATWHRVTLLYRRRVLADYSWPAQLAPLDRLFELARQRNLQAA